MKRFIAIAAVIMVFAGVVLVYALSSGETQARTVSYSAQGVCQGSGGCRTDSQCKQDCSAETCQNCANGCDNCAGCENGCDQASCENCSPESD